jgi:hypothetical protein
VPSTVFVAYVTVLVRSGAFNGQNIDVTRAAEGLGSTAPPCLAWPTLLVALTLHPLQYALIQLFEEYWGSTAAGRFLAVQNILRHRRRAIVLKQSAVRSECASPAQAVAG